MTAILGRTVYRIAGNGFGSSFEPTVILRTSPAISDRNQWSWHEGSANDPRQQPEPDGHPGLKTLIWSIPWHGAFMARNNAEQRDALASPTAYLTRHTRYLGGSLQTMGCEIDPNHRSDKKESVN